VCTAAINEVSRALLGDDLNVAVESVLPTGAEQASSVSETKNGPVNGEVHLNVSL